MIHFILLFALGLRLININQSLWLDEAFQFKASYFFSLKEMLTVYLPGDFNPPLSYLINYYIGQLFGYSELSLRLPSVIFGVLTVWYLYKLAGKWPALLLATSGLHVYYSQEARMYSLATLAVTASFYYLKKSRWLGYTVAGLAAIYSHYLTIFIFPAQLLLVNQKNRMSLKKSWGAIALGFLPWLPLFWQQLLAGAGTAGTAWGNVVGGLTLKSLALIPVKFLIGRISLDNNLNFGLIMTIPVAASIWLVWRGRRERMPVMWLLIPAILIIIFSVYVPVLAYFRLLFLLPAFYWLLAVRPTRSLLVGLLAFNLVTTGIYLFNPVFHREDWRAAAKVLDDRPVVIINAVNAPLKYYYAGDVHGIEAVPETDFAYVAYAEDIFDPGRDFRHRVEAAGYKEQLVEMFRGNIALIQYKR